MRPLRWVAGLFRRHQLFVAYLLIVATMAVGYVKFERTSMALCRSVEKNRAVLHDLVNRQGSQSAPPGSSPELVRAYEQGRKAGEEFRSGANRLLDTITCPH